VNLVSKMYGGSLRPGDPRRFIVEALVGAMRADGVVTPEELEVLETSLQEHEIFSGLKPEATKLLIDIANESIAFLGSPVRRIPFMAAALPSRTHRMAAYAVASEIALADGESPAEVLYLRALKNQFLLSDDEARSIHDAAKKRRGMTEVEDRTRRMIALVPTFVECMALMAAADGEVTETERRALLGVLMNVGDLAILSGRELSDAIQAAFKKFEGRDPDREIAKIAAGLESPSDRYWAAVYMMIIAVAGGVRDWRQVFFLGSAQEALRLDDRQMDKAMATAKLFPVPYR
jgi:tellurite resistance protein